MSDFGIGETFDPPSWLTAKVDQRLALMVTTISAFGDPTPALDKYTIMMTLLTEPPEGSTPGDIAKWERTCDNCGRYCSDDEAFFTGTTVRERWGTQILFTFGSCSKCKESP